MGLPYAIEYLLTLERPGGGRLVNFGVSQLVIPVFPPSTSIQLTTSPWGDDYAYISYYSGFGPAMVPDNFTITLTQYGNLTYSAVISSLATGLILEGYLPITQSEPSISSITNITTLNQYYEGIVFFVRIATAADWELVREALATAVKSKQLAGEANRLLRVMAGEPALEGS